MRALAWLLGLGLGTALVLILCLAPLPLGVAFVLGFFGSACIFMLSLALAAIHR